MDRICALLINLHFETKRLSRQRIGDRLTELALRNLSNGHIFEAMWQIYALRGLKYVVTSQELIKLASDSSDSVIPLILLDMRAKKLCVVTLPQKEWEERVTKDNVQTSPGWLLAYEGIRHGWLNDPNGLSATAFFAPMLARNVIFYDDRRNVTLTVKMVFIKRLFQVSQRRRVSNYLTRLRGFALSNDYE